MEAAIRSYMDEGLTAFQLDEAISEISEKTDDKTVRHIGRALWFHYDDITDHKIVASQEEWDYFNRLALVLKSDAEIDVAATRRRWSWQNGIAAIAFVGFLLAAVYVGWGAHLFVVAIPFGIVSMLLGYWAGHARRRLPGNEIALTPFPSVASLLSVRRGAAGFSKSRYPSHLRSRTIRSPVASKVLLLPAKILWLLVAPVALLFQMVPQAESTTRIRMPEPSARRHGSPAEGSQPVIGDSRMEEKE